MSHAIARSLRLAVALAILVLGTAGPVHAAGLPQGAGAAGGLNNWYTLPAGGSAEWIFHYPGSNDPALIAFGVDPANSIAVNVYNEEQWRVLGAGDRSVEPVGRGTAGTAGVWNGNRDLIDNGQLFWEASARPAVTFHIQVINTTQAAARELDRPGRGRRRRLDAELPGRRGHAGCAAHVAVPRPRPRSRSRPPGSRPRPAAQGPRQERRPRPYQSPVAHP